MSYYNSTNTNASLNRAQTAGRDEFYTPYDFIATQLDPYIERGDFEGKTVYCPCDNPWQSNFAKYFVDRFNEAGLKKLICTCTKGQEATPGTGIDDTGHTVAPWIAIVTAVDPLDTALLDVYQAPGNSCSPVLDGKTMDFAGKDCDEFFTEADVIVTNPPFSKFALFVKILNDYKKPFIIIGSLNACTYKTIYPQLKSGALHVCCDVRPSTVEFEVPDTYEINPASGDFIDPRTGKKYASLRNVRWYSTLPPVKCAQYRFTKEITGNQDKYPKYDNCDAIECGRVADIPWGYTGVIGCPVTILDYYDPEIFQLVGDIQELKIQGKAVYKRLFVTIKYGEAKK